MRRPSNAARDLIARREGLRLLAYRDSAGVWTIGYGHTRGVREGQRITQIEAEDFLVADMLEAVRTIYAHCQADVIDALPQPCFDALVSFVFNVGAQAFASPTTGKRTDFWRALHGADLVEVARQMQRWVKAGGQVLPGLVARRGEEAALWGAGLEAARTQPAPRTEAVIEELPTSVTPDAPRTPPAIQQPGIVAGAAAGASGIAAAAATLSGAGTSVAMSQDRIALVIGLALILLGAGLMIWLARR